MRGALRSRREGRAFHRVPTVTSAAPPPAPCEEKQSARQALAAQPQRGRRASFPYACSCSGARRRAGCTPADLMRAWTSPLSSLTPPPRPAAPAEWCKPHEAAATLGLAEEARQQAGEGGGACGAAARLAAPVRSLNAVRMAALEPQLCGGFSTQLRPQLTQARQRRDSREHKHVCACVFVAASSARYTAQVPLTLHVVFDSARQPFLPCPDECMGGRSGRGVRTARRAAHARARNARNGCRAAFDSSVRPSRPLVVGQQVPGAATSERTPCSPGERSRAERES